MLRKANEAVSEGNVPIPQQEQYESGQPTLLVNAHRHLKLMMIFKSRRNYWKSV